MRRIPLIPLAARFPLCGALAMALPLSFAASVGAQTTFTVNTSNDVDDGICDATHCSLREAITAANNAGGGLIAFDIPGSGPHTITPSSELPAIVSDVTLDGTTEPDFAGAPVVELDGSNTPANSQGLVIVGSGNVIRGMVVNRFPSNGISIGADASGNAIEGNYVGTDVSGNTSMGNGNAGVLVGQAPNNTIGGTTAEQRNVISGNIEGVTIVDPTATGNLVIGNYIGTNATGDAAVPNNVGVLLLAPGNTIGGSTFGEANVISGNTLEGVSLGPPNATGNVIVGNYIGTDVSGGVALANQHGVVVNDVPDNTIGGVPPALRNVISGNGEMGILMFGENAIGNIVQGNYIGTNAAGDAALGNGTTGVLLFNTGTLIGGATAGAGNVIAGNGFAGIDLGDSAGGTVIQGNYIGTDVTGSVAIGNDLGMFVNFSADNVIGGSGQGEGNVVSGNNGDAIQVNGAGATGNVIQGNFIGTDATGSNALGNGLSGVIFFDDAADNTLGGTAAGAGNVIAHNGANGVVLVLLAGSNNRVLGNAIYDNALLGIDLGGDGVTANDAGDVDTGPNNLQNYPELTVVASGNGAAITAELNSLPNATYTLEFFSSDACDDSGNGEGEDPLRAETVSTDGSGIGSVVATVSGVTAGAEITATATDASGNTSEFSACAAIPDFAVDVTPASRTVAAGESASYTVDVTAEGGDFDEPVTLSCSGLPSGAACSFSPGEVTPGSGEATSTMTVTTVARGRSAVMAPRRVPNAPVHPVWIGLAVVAVLIALAAVGRWGTIGTGSIGIPVARVGGLVGLVVVSMLVLHACGDNNGTGPPGGGTPAGTYEITVTGTWESVEHSAAATLVVE